MRTHIWFETVVFTNSRNHGLLTKGKRMEAIFQFWKKMFHNEGDKAFDLPDVTFLAPPLAYQGWAKKLDARQYVYLPATLEFESLARVTHTVAHEIAHVVLGHCREGALDVTAQNQEWEDRPHEIAADALAAEWGFPPVGGKCFLEKVINEYCGDGLNAKASKWMKAQLDGK
jgi:hypothetical protein